MPDPALPTPVSEPPALPAGPSCVACRGDAAVHWLRRPTDDELSAVLRVEKERRKELLLLADPQQPAPVFPSLPSAAGMTVTVYACSEHAVSLEAAALVHQSGCTAPNDADLPGCDCAPEPAVPEPADDPAPVRALPAHWVSGGA